MCAQSFSRPQRPPWQRNGVWAARRLPARRQAGTKRWDTAACDALLLALGGFLCDAQGRPYGHSSPIRDRPDNAEGVLAGVHHWGVLRDRLGW